MAHLEEFASEKEKVSFAKETFDVYVPVASRLGIYRMKTDLEDLAFMYLNPEEYKRISEQIEQMGRSRRIAVTMIKKELSQFLSYCGYRDCEIIGRLKSVYSIYRKLKKKGLNSIDDIFDVFAMRVILPSQFDDKENEQTDHLYHLLGMIHGNWKPVTKKFKDYVAVPKPNGYRSLHTVVVGLVPDNPLKPVEIQLRSSEMHRHAEYGVASHWIYKQTKGSVTADVLQSQVDWLKGLEKVHDHMEGDADMLKEVEVDIFRDRIFVLTPKGEIKDLPAKSIPLDFAFAVHTDVGQHCIMAKVNGNVASLDQTLKNGDVVEIITRKDATPKMQWLSMVKTGFAKNKIRSWFNHLDRENSIKQGRLLLNKQLEKFGLPSLDQNYSILKQYGGGKDLTLEQRDSLLEEVGSGHKLASNVIRNVYPYERIFGNKGGMEVVEVKGGDKDLVGSEDLSKQILVGGEDGLPIKLGSCCSPTIKDEIIGYVTRGNSITIHSKKCALLGGLDEERIIEAKWRGIEKNIPVSDSAYRTKLKVAAAVSRVGLIRDVSAVIASLGIDIVDIHMEIVDNQICVLHLLVDMNEPNKLNTVLDKLMKVSEVVQAVRED
jgi:GTP pyrophosphokinase